MTFDIKNVEIIPNEIIFNHVEPQGKYCVKVSVKNKMDKSISLRFYAPENKCFKLKTKSEKVVVATGLEIKGLIELTVDAYKDTIDRLVLVANDNVIKIPIKMYVKKPVIEFDGVVDFGTILANQKIFTQEIVFKNIGSSKGNFTLNCEPGHFINFKPLTSTIDPGKCESVSVELLAFTEQNIEHVVKISLDDNIEKEMTIKAKIVSPKLHFLHSTSTDENQEKLMEQIKNPIKIIRLGGILYGTDSLYQGILYNESPEYTNFVVSIENYSDDSQSICSMFSVFPNEGTLDPNGKINIFIKFSPRLNTKKCGFKHISKKIKNEEISVILKFKILGGFKINQQKSFEIGILALSVYPKMTILSHKVIEFPKLRINESAKSRIVLKNISKLVNLTIESAKIAHFTVTPGICSFQPNEIKNLEIKYNPKQLGNLNTLQRINIIGYMCDKNDMFQMNKISIHTVVINLIAECIIQPIDIPFKINLGITPRITNEIGLSCDIPFKNINKNQSKNIFHNCTNSSLHNIGNILNSQVQNDIVSFPNDRPQSLKPCSQKNGEYRTIFKKIPRYTYVDVDYMHNEISQNAKMNNEKKYKDYLKKFKNEKYIQTMRRDYFKFNNSTDIEIRPAVGLQSPNLSLENLEIEKNSNEEVICRSDSLKNFILSKIKTDGLYAVPMNKRQHYDCSLVLSPIQLNKIIIEPTVIDFGEICSGSVVEKMLKIINGLKTWISFNLKIKCKELCKTSPINVIIPPLAHVSIPLVFESLNLGKFIRSVNYAINNFYSNHITIMAQLEKPRIHIEKNLIFLKNSLSNVSLNSYAKSMITLKNELNSPANFNWNPVISESGTAISIRPACGVIAPNSILKCEARFHCYYNAPLESLFNLCVKYGDSQSLKCVASIGKCNVSFMKRRLNLGAIPLFLTTKRIIYLKNTGPCVAYYRVVETEPIKGMRIYKDEGCICVNSTCGLILEYTPTSIKKFDCLLKVNVRGCRPLSLRIGGMVEYPTVSILEPNFPFGGVYVGGEKSVPFTIINNSSTDGRILFNLKEYSDFSIQFEDISYKDGKYIDKNAGIYAIDIGPTEKLKAKLTFKPTRIASYNFIASVFINNAVAPTPSNTPEAHTPCAASRNTIDRNINPTPVIFNTITPKRKITATSLCKLIEFSENKVYFLKKMMYEESKDVQNVTQKMLISNTDECEHVISVSNLIPYNSKTLQFFEMYINQQNATNILGDTFLLKPHEEIFIFMKFNPDKIGSYNGKVHFSLKSNQNCILQALELEGDYKCPYIEFDPIAYISSPIPTHIKQTSKFKIIGSEYDGNLKLEFSVPKMLSHLSVDVKITPQERDVYECELTHYSEKTCNIRENIVFIDNYSQRFNFTIVVIIDNSLMTVFPFIITNQHNYRIICHNWEACNGSDNEIRGTPNLVYINKSITCFKKCENALYSNYTSDSNSFTVNSSTIHSRMKLTSTPYCDEYGKQPMMGSTPGRECSRPQTADSYDDIQNNSETRCIKAQLFPQEYTEEGMFYSDALISIEKWFSCHGWPGIINPVSIPDSFRNALSKGVNHLKNKKLLDPMNTKSLIANEEFNNNSLMYSLIFHITGNELPGIGPFKSISNNFEDNIKCIYWQNQTLLTFIRSNGGCVAAIQPEYLMTYVNYCDWKIIQKKIMYRRYKNGFTPYCNFSDYPGQSAIYTEEILCEEIYDTLSKRCWSDVLMQILKVFVIGKITIDNLGKYAHSYKLSAVSNIYSTSENIILHWLNCVYDEQRQIIWKDKQENNTTTRWIVNFDYDLMDGIVIICLIAKYLTFLVDDYLVYAYTQPCSPVECLHNALLIVSSLRSVGFNYDIEAIDITDPNPISMLLFCTHLMKYLPQFENFINVTIEAKQHKQNTKKVEIYNPSNKTIAFTPVIVGKYKKNFNLVNVKLKQIIKLGPKAKFVVNISFFSNFHGLFKSWLIFIGQRLANISDCCNNICFVLNGEINEITVLASYHETIHCYDVHNFFLNVDELQNSDNYKINFTSININKYPNDEKNVNELAPCYLFGSKSSIVLDENKKYKINLIAIALKTGIWKFYMHLTHEKLGEYRYKITLKVALPKNCRVPYKYSESSIRLSTSIAASKYRQSDSDDFDKDILYWFVKSSDNINQNINIPYINELKMTALSNIYNFIMKQNDFNKNFEILKSDEEKLSIWLKKHLAIPLRTTYNVTCLCNLVDVPQITTIDDLYKMIDNEYCLSLNVRFSCRSEKIEKFDIILESEHDIRVLRIHCDVSNSSSDPKFLFKTYALEKIVQNIPIINQTENDWILNVLIEGSGFSGPTTLHVPAHRVAEYILTYAPIIVGNVETFLFLNCDKNDVHFKFPIFGEALNPRPYKTLEVDCICNERKMIQISVPNLCSRRVHFVVSNSLPFLTGKSSLSVIPGQEKKYELNIYARKSGDFQDIVVFKVESDNNIEYDSDGDKVDISYNGLNQHSVVGYNIYYYLNVHATKSDPIKTINISAECMKPVEITIPISNLTESAVEYHVEIEGKCFSSQNELILINEGETFEFILTYCPSYIDDYFGSVTFGNELSGEFWYAVKGSVKETLVTMLPILKCELGKWTSTNIELYNPTAEDIIVCPFISNETNYTIDINMIKIESNSYFSVPIKFMPLRLGSHNHHCNISFVNDNFPGWKFHISGVGLVPNVQETTDVACSIGKVVTIVIPFRNPTDQKVYMDYHLRDYRQVSCEQDEIEEQESCFKIIHSNSANNVEVDPNNVCEISILYSPLIFNTSQTEIIINLSYDKDKKDDRDVMTWVYPIIGRSEIIAPYDSSNIIKFVASEKTRLIRSLNINLDNMSYETNHAFYKRINNFEIIWDVEDQYKELFDNCVVYVIESLKNVDSTKTTMIIINVVYRPENIHVFAADMILRLKNKIPYNVLKYSNHQVINQGQWRFSCVFESTVEQPDRKFIIESKGLKEFSTYKFLLESTPNKPMQLDEFTVEIEGNDAIVFSVHPMKGVFNDTTQIFEIKFLPSQYGMIYNAILIIKTENCIWRFVLEGKPPIYNIPLGRSFMRELSKMPDSFKKIKKNKKKYVLHNKLNVTFANSSPFKNEISKILNIKK